MQVVICENASLLGGRASADGAQLIRNAIADRNHANIIVATGASQFETLAGLVAAPAIDWSKVAGFHLDEYIGLPESHPASFRKYLKERFVEKVPIGAFHYVSGDGDPDAECGRLGAIIREQPIDVAFIGIGENGHLAFNDPPADFDTEQPYIVVDLDEACRNQQFGEGWFDSLDDVPKRAISMSVKQIIKSAAIVCSVPDERKAEAVRDAIEGGVTPDVPASILQRHLAATVYLDKPSASKLSDVEKYRHG